MQKLKNAISGILIKAALASKDKPIQKQRLMTLWENGIIPAETVERLFSVHALKGE